MEISSIGITYKAPRLEGFDLSQEMAPSAAVLESASHLKYNSGQTYTDHFMKGMLDQNASGSKVGILIKSTFQEIEAGHCRGFNAKLAELAKLNPGNYAKVLARGYQMVAVMIEHGCEPKANLELIAERLLEALKGQVPDRATLQKLLNQPQIDLSLEQAKGSTLKTVAKITAGLALTALVAYGIYYAYTNYNLPVAENYNSPEPETEKITTYPTSPANLCETMKDRLCHNHLGISRKLMPQIEGPQLNQFKAYLVNNSTAPTSWEDSVGAHYLTSTQSELDGEKVLGMVNAIAKKGINLCEGGIIASSDGHVLDGHHRWAACSLLGRKIRTLFVDLPIVQLLELTKQFNSGAKAFGQK